MKQIFSLFLFVTAIFSLKAQDRPEEIQKIIDNNQERFVFEFTHDRAIGDEAPDITPFSRGINMYYMKNIPLSETSKFSVAPGLGFATRQLYMDNVYTYDPSTDVVSLPAQPDGLEKNVSKLAFTYVEVPVELRWASKPNNRGHSFKLATGFRAGYLISNKFKYRGDVYTDNPFVNDGDDLIYNEKFKIKKLENLVSYRVAPSARIGYGSVNLFGLYQINNDFDSGKGPEMNGISVGISISSF